MKRVAYLTAVAAMSVGSALAMNITIQDKNPANNSFGGGPAGQGKEDNEVETRAGGSIVSSQDWDLEAVAVQGSMLYLIGGYDFTGAFASSGSTLLQNDARPGDLFIKLGGPKPGPGPTTDGATVFNNNGLYDYAIDFFVAPDKSSVTGAQLLALNDDTVLATGRFDSTKANPWQVARDADVVDEPLTVTYDAGLTAAQVSALTGVSGLLGGVHNVVGVSIDWLLSINEGTIDEVWWHYTMGCGNDMLDGYKPPRVPDGGMSLVLLGLGLGALGLTSRAVRKN